MMRLLYGDCLKVLPSLPENSVDSIVTDPPYGISFMNKKWDYNMPSVEIWEECLRVLKPGGHLLCFASTRTFHRMVVNIEDAGFDIRDSIAWMHGQGFPKSLNIGKSIDKMAGAKRKVVGKDPNYHSEGKRAGSGKGLFGEAGKMLNKEGHAGMITEPATDDAKKWDGWGTALKPAMELIAVARKPFKGTVAKNVLEHGTGGMNIDACRIGDDEIQVNRLEEWSGFGQKERPAYTPTTAKGRYPANVILDEEAGAVLDEQSGDSAAAIRYGRRAGKATGVYGEYSGQEIARKEIGDSGGASRFFYCAKANKKERGEGNNHPTVKPLKLMEYLCRLVTPKNGTILDPFMGSGSTGKAAYNEGFDFIGIEMDGDYMEIAENRLEKPREEK